MTNPLEPAGLRLDLDIIPPLMARGPRGHTLRVLQAPCVRFEFLDRDVRGVVLGYR